MYIAVPMKNIIYSLTLVILLCAVSCQKQESDRCTGIFCQNGGTCVDGDCQCINGFTGNRCQTAFDSCSITSFCGHGNCDNGHCNCDLNWTGLHCDQQIAPIDSFVGVYRMVGYETTDSLGVTIPRDDTVIITKLDEINLSISAYAFVYENYYGDVANYHNYLWQSNTNSNYSLLSFNKTLDDSAHYVAEAGYKLIVLNGKKIQ
jgi:hypothetical protein